MITRRLVALAAGAMIVLGACSSTPSTPAGGSGGLLRRQDGREEDETEQGTHSRTSILPWQDATAEAP